MSPQSGGHKSDQLEPAGSPKESPRRLTEVPSIATPNRFALLEATSNADEALVRLPKKGKLDLEAKGTTYDGAPMSCNTIRSVQAPASSGSESQPARRQTESSCEGMQLHPEQRPVISRASTSHALVGSTSEASNSRKSMESTAKAQSEGQTHLGQTRAPDRAQGQDLVAATEQSQPEPARVQAWRAAGYPNCNTCGKRHPPPCKPELIAESRQRAQKKQQRKEERRQQIAEEQQQRQNKKDRQLFKRPRLFKEAEAYQYWPEVTQHWLEAGQEWLEAGHEWSVEGQEWSVEDQEWSEAGQEWSDAGQDWAETDRAWSETGQEWTQTGQEWSDAGQEWSETGRAWSETDQNWPKLAPPGPPPPPPPPTSQTEIGQRAGEEAEVLPPSQQGTPNDPNQIQSALFESMSEETKYRTFTSGREVDLGLFASMSEATKYRVMMHFLGH